MDGLSVGLLNDLVIALKNDIVGKTAMLDDARNVITNTINPIIGEHPTVTYDNFIKLTRMKDATTGVVEGLMNPDVSQNSIKGNIFEYWGTRAINRMTPFPFVTPSNTSTPQQPILLQRKNPTALNNLQNTNNKPLTVDGYFILPNATNPLLVAVEFKHAQDIPSDQLDHRSMIKPGTVDHFVYIFAEQPTTAMVNRLKRVLTNVEIYYFSINSFTKIP